MTQRVAAGLPWGPANWPTMLARAAKWHRSRLEYPPEHDATWFDPGQNPPEAAHSRLGYRLVPLNSPSRLETAELLLGQPLYRYRTGPDDPLRAFVATAPGAKPAVIVLSSESGSWQIHQLSVPGPRRPSKLLHRLADQLAQAFQDHDPRPAVHVPEPNAMRGEYWLHDINPQRTGAPVHAPPSFEDIIGALPTVTRALRLKLETQSE